MLMTAALTEEPNTFYPLGGVKADDAIACLVGDRHSLT